MEINQTPNYRILDFGEDIGKILRIYFEKKFQKIEPVDFLIRS